MEEPEKGLSTSETSEPKVSHDEKVGGETLEGSVEYGGQVQVEGSLVGEGGKCNGKDVVVETIGSDVCIEGVCTRGSGAEVNDEVGRGESVEGGEDLGKDVNSAGVGSGTEARFEDSRAVKSEETRSENAAVELDGAVSEREVRDQAVVGSDECGVGLLQDEALLDDRDQKEVGTGVGDSSGNIEVPVMEDVEVDCTKSADVGATDDNLTNTRCDNDLGSPLIGSSVGGENVQCRRDEKDNLKDKNAIDHGTPEDGNDATLETLDEQENIGNLQSDKMLDKEACISDKVEVEEKVSSTGEQPIGKDKVDDNPRNIQEVVSVTEVAIDKALSNSDEKESFSLEKCTEKERMTDSLQLRSDTGQTTADKDMGSYSALDVSCSAKKEELGTDVEDQPETERNKMSNDTAEIKGTAVSSGSEKFFDANATVEKDGQITDQGHLVPLDDGKEKINDESNMRQNVEERAGISEQVGSNGGQEIEEFNEAEQRKPTDRKAKKRAVMKPVISEVFHQARYSLPIEKEDEFSLSDMVWGKVKSHPWWPGQIFDPSYASEKARKHYKKDCHLVAYFGDRTFAWNEASKLKPFRSHFSSVEKQSTSESFHNAVDCALDEVRRRVEYGLACSCIPKDTYDTIRFQTVENTGIRQELSCRHGVDESLNASSFSPTKLVEYLKTLSELPTGGFDRLELVIAKAQLLAFYRFKGYSCLPEEQLCGDLGYDTENSFHDDEKQSSKVIELATPVVKNNAQDGLGNLKNKSSSRQKGKYNLRDTTHSTKKERRLSELMGRTPDSPDGDCRSDDNSKKRRTIDHYADADDSGMQDEKVTDNLVSPGPSKKRRAIDHHADDSGMQDEKLTDNLVSHGPSKKRRAIDHYADDSGMQDENKTISLAKVSNTTKPSFKIGDCIRRVASQLTGSPSMLKSSSDRVASQLTGPPSMLKSSSDQVASQLTGSPSMSNSSSEQSQKTDGDIDGIHGNGSDVSLPTFEEAQKPSMTLPTEYSSLDDLLSSLKLVALEPQEEYSFPNAIVSFFSDFRNSIILANDSGKEMCTDKVGTKRKKPPIAGPPETFEFEDMNDTYWTDMVIDNGKEEQPAQAVQQAQPSRKNRKKEHQPVPAEPEKPIQAKRRSYTRKQHSDSNHAEAPEKPPGYIDENAPAELVMNFAELDSVPSEVNLNKMFRRFGPLKESETEVDRVSCRARVVFKKCVDAEVACSSAKKFNIFGSIPVNYQLNYTPSALFKASSIATTQDQEMHLDLSNFEVDMV